MQQSLENSPLISILLPTHNRADVLPFAIQSVLAQTIQDFELLIVGDGCTDNTAEIVQSFSDPRIQWHDLPKAPGFGYANRNIVLRLARGEFIAYMAHDDLWLSDHLEQLLPFFSDEKIEIVYSRPLWVIPFGMIVPGMFNLDHAPTLKIFLNKESNLIPAGFFIHRRECFFKYGYWNDNLPAAGDQDMWVRIIKGGREKNFVYVGCPTCLHFKANWRDESYDTAFGFNYWRRLFAAGQMPFSLKVEVKDGVSEQEAVWEAMLSDPQRWAKQIRIASQQVLDRRAFEGNYMFEYLLSFHGDRLGTPISFHPIWGFDMPVLLDELLRNETDVIRKTLTWRIRERFINNSIFRFFHSLLISPLRKVFTQSRKK